MNPLFRELAGLVEPYRDRAGARPRHLGGAGPRILAAEHLGHLGTGPIEELGHQARADPAGGTDPLRLQVIQPAHEFRLAGPRRGRRAVIAVTLPGQQPEVIAEQVAAQPEDPSTPGTV